MEIWNDPASIVAPVYIGFRQPRTDYSGVADAFENACSNVPATHIVMRQQASAFRKESVPSAREVHSVAGVDGSYRRRALCVPRAPHQKLAEVVDAWQWEAGYTVFRDGSQAPAIPSGLVPISLEVSRFRVNRGAVRAAPQLALFRHLFVAGLRELDPDLVVFGGQHEWHPTMWIADQAV